MAVWETSVITNKGLALLAKLSSGNTLSFVRAVSGSGYVDPSLLQIQTTVTNKVQDLSFGTQKYTDAGSCTVPVNLSNDGVSTAYTVNQIGIMAMDTDGEEILFLIAQANPGNGTYVPAESDSPGFSAAWNFTLQYGQADGVSITVDPSNSASLSDVSSMIDAHNTSSAPHDGVLATKNELSSHAGNTANPHKVTAAQVGLGNVNNTADAEKKVAFASSAGEASKVKYSLIVRANGGTTEGTNMWTYNGSTSKSINITPASIGAAASNHIQAVDKGGTGATNAADARVNLGIETAEVPVTIAASGWVGDSAPYAQTVTVAGLVDGKRVMVYPAYGDDTDANIAMRDACACVSYAKRSGNRIVLTCLEDKPDVDIDAIVEVYV